MSNIIEEIKQPVKAELDLFEDKFREAMKSKVALLDKITYYIIKRKGKQIRPLFVFLSAKLTGDVNENTYTAASLVELLHTATLVHDDVVDDANERRGFFSINALWKNKIAILVGDYLLSRGLLLSVKNKQFQLLEIVTEAVQEMSEGELLQMEKTRKLDITEEVYFEIIRQKTASLFAAACGAGAASTKPGDDIILKMKKFGEYAGLAFQIKDDLFDYGDIDVGKPLGIDIKEKKMTLPLIYALEHTTKLKKRQVKYIIKNKNKQTKKVKEVIDFVHESGGIAYTKDKMIEYRDRSLEVLHQFPESPARQSLEQLINFTIDRKK